jgi:Uncharacterized protein conserved in bacteria (DUF2066)
MPFYFVVCLALVLGFPAVPAFAGAAPAPAAPVPAPGPPDLYVVGGIQIDATSGSVIAARDAAMAEGRRQAWTRLYRRLTSSTQWARQPQLGDNMLLRLIGRVDVVNERRSTTRYVADVTYQFHPATVRTVFEQSSIPYTDVRSRPVLVVPVVAGSMGFDGLGPWTTAWSAETLQQGLVPFVLPTPSGDDAALLAQMDLTQADWAALEPLVARHKAEQAIVAVVSEDARTVQMIEISAAGRRPFSFAYAQSTLPADAEAVAERANETWKLRVAVDFSTRATILADAQFSSLADWAKIRNGLGAVRAISAVDILGLALDEAEISLTYSGRPEQLRDALSQQDLELIEMDGRQVLRLEGQAAVSPGP